MDSLMQLVAVAVLAGSCAGWGTAFCRIARKQPVLPHDPRRCAPWGLIDLALAALLLAVFHALSVLVLRHGCGIDSTQGWERLASRELAVATFAEPLANLAAITLALTLIGLRTAARCRDFGISLRHVPQDLRLGLAAFMMLAPPVYGIQKLLVVWFPYRHPLISMLQQHTEAYVQAAVCFSAVVAAPIVEEFFYRVLWQGWLQDVLSRQASFPQLVFGRPAAPACPPSDSPAPANGGDVEAALQPSPAAEALAILGCAALFAAMHISHGPAPIPLFVLALGLGYVYARTGRVLPCIVVHLLLNGCSLAALLMELRSCAG
ncbi:MAG: CPBP family intramembrane metalloprotease [Candidatus Anammoximicrobium sp.]|nr:CPBP family intramembrane metalloprotease [Candidatus Anammoximicrobium sp.]